VFLARLHRAFLEALVANLRIRRILFPFVGTMHLKRARLIKDDESTLQEEHGQQRFKVDSRLL
jgi:hypothetical protein